MRGVQESEVVESIDQLNEIYAATNRCALSRSGAGFRLQLADDLSSIRNRFYGRVRAGFAQSSRHRLLGGDLLSAWYFTQRRTRTTAWSTSGSLLSQLIRRQLVEMCRETAENSPGDKKPADKKTVQRYYPTQRLLDWLASNRSTICHRLKISINRSELGRRAIR
ncbi:MAG: hypothetical protein R3C56_23885 [Pirellulaceae bacterium]